MSSRAILRKQVPDDLESIFNYLADVNPRAAARFLDAAELTFAELATHPGLGSPKNYRGKKYVGLRTWRIKGFKDYLVLYRPVDVGVVVFAVCHGARNLKKLLRDRIH